MDSINTAVRIIVVAFVFIGVALTLAGPKIIAGNNVASPDKPAPIESNSNKITTSERQSAQAHPEKTS